MGNQQVRLLEIIVPTWYNDTIRGDYIMLKECEWCKKEFETQNVRKVYCSKNCGLKSNRRKHRDVSKLKFDYFKIQEIKTKKLNYIQRQVIIGGLIGDGSINKNYSYCLTQCDKQKEYLDYKTQLMGEIFQRKAKPYIKDNRMQWSTGSIKHPELIELRDIAYPDGKLTINSWIDEIDELGLTIWYLDDGCFNKDKRSLQCSLSTAAYSWDENIYLRDFLMNKFNIKSRILTIHDKRYDVDRYGLTINKGEAITFRQIVKPFTPRTMMYKIE